MSLATAARQRAESERMTLVEKLIELGRVLRIADENGLFCERGPKPKFDYKTIFNTIYAGLGFLDPANPDLISARKNYEIAYHQIYTTIDNTRRSWRFTYVFGVPIFLYFFAVSLVVIWLWFFNYSEVTTSTVLWVPIWAYIWGLVGGVFRGVWTLWHALESQSLRRHLIAWYFILPFMGAILGAIAYLIFLAGFIVSTGADQIASEAFVMLLCVLAGFSSKWAVMLLIRVSDLIQPRTESGES